MGAACLFVTFGVADFWSMVSEPPITGRPINPLPRPNAQRVRGRSFAALMLPGRVGAVFDAQ